MYIENIHTAKTHLSQLIKRALAGEEVVIARAGEPLVKLTPVQRDLTPRRGGQLKDRIRIAADFDLFDEELERLFYGEPE
jgi:prevent-host-death family protein